MTWATALFEVSLSDTMGKVLHDDVIAILFPRISEPAAAPTAAGAHKVCQDKIAEVPYTLDWAIEWEVQTNVITAQPKWELGA